MAEMMNIVTIILLVSWCVLIVKAQSIIDVTKNGTKARGSYINWALTSIWKEACVSASPTKVLILQQTFLLGPVILEGPCKAAIEVEVEVTLKALIKTKRLINTWVKFLRIKKFTLLRGGTFDGYGSKGCGRCDQSKYHKQLPIFDFIIDDVAPDITSLDNKQFHVNVLSCKNITFECFAIIILEQSPNTDKIHIRRSKGVKITSSNRRSGDDFISMVDGSQQILITNVTCEPGHGISIGSLGKMQNEDPVARVTVEDCTLNNTDNGVRIKTWPASYKDSVSNVHFEDIAMVNVSNHIIIDKSIAHGTSEIQSGVPYQGMEIANIDLKYIGKDGPVTFEDSNVKPMISSKKTHMCLATLLDQPQLALLDFCLDGNLITLQTNYVMNLP